MPASLTFTAANWSTPQTVTVTGVNDDIDDGDVAYSIVTAAAVSADPKYSELDAADVEVTNQDDDDTAGITVAPTSDLLTDETGSTATFTVVLDSEPTADVTIGLSSSDPTEGTALPASLTFTASNWNTPQTVTVTGVNDDIDDGDVAYSIVTAAAVSADPKYSELDAADVEVTNQDDGDTAEITVAPTSDLLTDETGSTATFTVVLDSEPTADVTIGLSSSDPTEGTALPASLTFTASNWNTPQTATVTGLNDDIDDGDVAYSIVTAAAVSADSKYSELDAADVEVTNQDDGDTAGITVAPTSDLLTDETGSTATFTVVLDSEPTADVTIGLSSSDPTEGTALPASLTFTASNWNTPQTATVTGLNDDIDDGDVAYSIVTAAAVSADSKYSELDAADVGVINQDDDDTAGITVVPTSGLLTDETGGTATFTVVLDSQPTADVTIGLLSSDPTEGTAVPASLTFTAANWSTPQTVTVTGVNDDIDDGNVAYSIVTAAAVSADPKYSELDAADVEVTNQDDGDTAGITVAPTSGLLTDETGNAATFTVVLDSEPTANVTIGLSSSDPTEGTALPASLTFTASNWNTPQTVTVTGVNDDIDDGDVAYSIITAAAVSADSNYGELDAADVTVTNQGYGDTAGVTVAPTSGLLTDETGTTATFTVVLDSEPTADVTIGLLSSDPTEGTASPASLTFTAANWNAPQTVTVTGVNDDIDDGNVEYSIVSAAAVSADPKYSEFDAADVGVTNQDDDDTAGITVSPTSGLLTDETGSAATFTVVLDSEPMADVTIGLSSSDPTEGTAVPASLTFTAANWSTPQTVTVTGVNDDIDDRNVEYSIFTAAAASADPKYSELDAADVEVTNQDNDTAGITVVPTSLVIPEGRSGTFTVQLNSQPTADVSIAVFAHDVTIASLQFTAGNWNTPQMLTVTALDDVAGDAIWYVTGIATSNDPDYGGRPMPPVKVTETGVTVTPISGLVTDETGVRATFTVVLDSEPTADVSIGISSSDTTEGTVSASNLMFTAANWSTPQTVTVTGVDDNIDDGDVAYSIVTAPASSSDPNYNGINPDDVTVMNTNDDTASIIIDRLDGSIDVSEDGITDAYLIVLGTEPVGNVSVALNTDGQVVAEYCDGGNGVFSPVNWNVPQTVCVSAMDDAVDESDPHPGSISHVVVSSDPIYDNLVDQIAIASIADNDTAGITVNPTANLQTDETGVSATFTVLLDSEPTADVTIGLSSSDPTEGTALSASLTFTAANWSVPQTVTVTGVNDDIDDGDVAYSIVTAAAVSADPNYNELNAADIGVTNQDDGDTAGITVVPTSGLLTDETGTTATFTMLLGSEPTADVTIGLSSSDPTEGTALPASLTFTAANWSVPQTVTVTGVNDDIDDGGVAYSIVTAAAVSNDSKYSELDAVDVGVTNQDDGDTAGITVLPTSGLLTDETGSTATFTVVLDSEPTADVTIGLSSSDATEGTALPASLKFTAADWSVPQTVTITGVNDDIDDDDVEYSILTAAAVSADPKYSELDAADIGVTNQDDGDTAGITVVPTSGLLTDETGTTATFTVVLDSEPTADVTIGLSSSDATEGTALPASLKFTAADWSVPQTVTITGVNDDIDDDDVEYSILTAAAESADPGYNGLDADDVGVTNQDDGDTAGITVAPASLDIAEGDAATFVVTLATQPMATVEIAFAHDGNVQITPNSLTFQPEDASPQTVTVTAVDDDLAEGLYPTAINLEVTGEDPSYQAVVVDEVMTTIVDNDWGDMFERPAAADLGQDWSQPTGLSIDSAQAVVTGDSGAQLALFNGSDFVDADGIIVEADVDLANQIGHAGLVARATNDGLNMYLGALCSDGITITAQIWRQLAGVWSSLATQQVPSQVQAGHLRLEISDSLLTLRLDGNDLAYASDSALQTPGLAGLRGTVGVVFDNFVLMPNTLAKVTLPYSESFDGADGALPAEWTCRVDQFVQQGGRAQTQGIASNHSLATLNSTEKPADVVVEADIALRSDLLATHAGLVARYDVATGDMYLGSLVKLDGRLAAHLWLCRAGVWKNLALEDLGPFANNPNLASGRLQFQVHGTSLRLSLNGQTIAATSNNELSTSGYAGMRGNDGETFDNVSVALSGGLPQVGSLTILTGDFVAQTATQYRARLASSVAVDMSQNAADVVVEADIALPSDASTSYSGLVARCAGPQEDSMYFGAIVKWPDRYEAHLWVQEAGVWQNLATVPITKPNQGAGRVTFQVHGNLLRLSFNGEVVAAVTDDRLAGPGYAGIRGDTGESFDNFTAALSSSVEQPGDLTIAYGDVTSTTTGDPPEVTYTVNLPSSVAIDTSQDSADVVVAADVAIQQGMWLTHAGLVARVSGPTRDEMYLGALVRWSDDHYEAHLWIKKDGVWRNLTVQPVSDANGGVGRLELAVHGDFLRLIFNGQAVAAATNDELASGYAGIRGTEGETLSDFVVTPLTSPPMIGDLQVVAGDFTADTTTRFTAVLPPSIAVDPQLTVADVTVRATVQLASGLSAAGLVARYSGPGDDNYYWGVLVGNGATQTLQLYRKLNGVVEQLGSSLAVSASSGLLELSVVGSSLKLTLGTDVLELTDFAITAAGQAGVRGYPGSSYENVTISNN